MVISLRTPEKRIDFGKTIHVRKPYECLKIT